MIEVFEYYGGNIKYKDKLRILHNFSYNQLWKLQYYPIKYKDKLRILHNFPYNPMWKLQNYPHKHVLFLTSVEGV